MTSTQSLSLSDTIARVLNDQGVQSHPAARALVTAVAEWKVEAAEQIVSAGTSLGGNEEAIRSILREAGIIDPLPEPEPASASGLSYAVEDELNRLQHQYPALAAALRAKLSE